MKKILIISFYPIGEDISMTLWTKDKLDALLGLGYVVHLLSSSSNFHKQLKYSSVFIVPSINPTWFLREVRYGFKLFYLLLLPLIFSLGLIFEIFERLILGRLGHGMWSWTISSLLFGILLKLRYRYDLILSLGGPTSAHLSSAILAKLSCTSNIIEFQDPIIGQDIGHNSRSSRYFLILEKFLISCSSKLVFVTKQSAIECQLRNPSSDSIHWIYSSSPKIFISRLFPDDHQKNRLLIKIGYFGNIYSTRNYDTFFLATKKVNNLKSHLTFELNHYGNELKPILNDLVSIITFKSNNVMSRDLAMQEALDQDLLLLIQHTDNRSKLTIPYKTWDYLNLQKPILALLNNDELKGILDGLGHYTCDVNNVDSIVDAILRFLYDFKNDKILIKPNPYDITKQVMELISL